MSDQNQTSEGIGFAGLLTIVFIVLKLTNVIAWSWWWILSPVWIPSALILLILGVCLLVRKIFIFRTREKYKQYKENIKKGMSDFAAFHAAYRKDNQPTPVKKSKFQQRLEEIQKRQTHQ